MRSEAAIGALQNIKFVAQILNGTEKALRVLHESDDHADLHRAAQNAQSAEPENQCDGRVLKNSTAGKKSAKAKITSLYASM